MLNATDSKVQIHGSIFFLSLILCVGVIGPAVESAEAQTIWATSFSFEAEGAIHETVQRIDTNSNSPDVVIENQIELPPVMIDLSDPSSLPPSEANGRSPIWFSFSLYGDSFFSVTSRANTRVNRWDAMTGEELDPVILEESFADHTMGGGLVSQVDHAANGDFLISSHGLGIEQRSIARFSPTGKHLLNYVHPNLMHQQGSAVATEDSVFVISRYNDSGTWVEKVLAFAADGDFKGELDVPVGQPTDLAIWNNELVVMGARENPDGIEPGGLNLYQLDGEGGLPQFLHSVSYPDGVDPLGKHLGSVAYEEGLFYVTEGSDVHQIDQTGELLETYSVQTFGARPDRVGDITVTSGSVQVPEPSGYALCLLAYMTALACVRRRSMIAWT